MTDKNRDFVEQVKNNVDIVEVISEYVDLKESGKNYKGLCPFHQENTPSFTVNPDNQFYYCFGCGAGGDVLEFLMEIEHITFRNSLKQLAKRAGLEMPNQSQYQKRKAQKREKLFNLNKVTAKFYNYLLLNEDIAGEARDYLKKRGFSDSDIKNYHLGYAPDRWRSLLKFLKNRGYNADILLESGLVKKKNGTYYDSFRGRIIFPIFNIRGEVLAFGARILADDREAPKYINSPETLIYDKGKNLYGINWAKSAFRKQDFAVIMEGYTDVLRAQKNGIKNTAASLGTSLTEAQARLLKRYVDDVYIAYDADTAGNNAALRGLTILKNKGLGVKIIKLPPASDPDDLIREKGPRKFQELIDNAVGYMEFKIENAVKNKDLSDTEDKIKAARSLVQILSEISDPIERNVHIQQVSEKLGIDPDIIADEVETAVESKMQEDSDNKSNPGQKAGEGLTDYQYLERRLLKAYIDHNQFRELIIEELQPEDFNNIYKTAADYLWKYPDYNLEELLNTIEKPEVEQFLMALAVAEKVKIKQEQVVAWIQQIIKRRLREQKSQIYQSLENEDLSVDVLNKLLLKFARLDQEQGKGGIKYDQ